MSEGEARLVGLHSKEESERLLACEELISLGMLLSTEQTLAIDRMLTSPQAAERFAASRVMARCWSPGHDTAALVAAALGEDHALLRSSLIRATEQAVALDPAARDSVIYALLSVIDDRGSTPRRRAAEVAARLVRLAGHEGLLTGLAGLLTDDSGPTRIAALAALGLLGGRPEQIAPLLADPQIDVAREALRALLKVAPADEATLGVLLRTLQGERPGLEAIAIEGLIQRAQKGSFSASPALLTGLVELLKAGVELPLRELACDAIGQLGGEPEAAFLIGQLHENAWGLRSALIDALFAMHGRGIPVASLLLPRLNEGPITARIEILQALGALGKSDPRVRQSILAVALQETRHTPRDAVDHSLREAACHALSLCGGPDEIRELIPHFALSSPVMMRRRALLATRSVCLSLAEQPSPLSADFLEALRRALIDPDDQCRRHSCESYCALAASPDEATKMAIRQALPQLMRRLCERHDRVARVARVALTRMGPAAPFESAILLAIPPGFGQLFASLLSNEGWSAPLRGELAKILQFRVRWYATILDLPASDLPADLPLLAALLIERARLFGERRRNCGGADGAQLREQAWVIAQSYGLLAR